MRNGLKFGVVSYYGQYNRRGAKTCRNEHFLCSHKDCYEERSGEHLDSAKKKFGAAKLSEEMEGLRGFHHALARYPEALRAVMIPNEQVSGPISLTATFVNAREIFFIAADGGPLKSYMEYTDDPQTLNMNRGGGYSAKASWRYHNSLLLRSEESFAWFARVMGEEMARVGHCRCRRHDCPQEVFTAVNHVRARGDYDLFRSIERQAKLAGICDVGGHNSFSFDVQQSQWEEIIYQIEQMDAAERIAQGSVITQDRVGRSLALGQSIQDICRAKSCNYILPSAGQGRSKPVSPEVAQQRQQQAEESKLCQRMATRGMRIGSVPEECLPGGAMWNEALQKRKAVDEKSARAKPPRPSLELLEKLQKVRAATALAANALAANATAS